MSGVSALDRVEGQRRPEKGRSGDRWSREARASRSHRLVITIRDSRSVRFFVSSRVNVSSVDTTDESSIGSA